MANSILSFVKAWVSGQNSEHNRRKYRRHARVTYVEVQPLDHDLSQFGNAVWGMTRDISYKGIGFTTEFELDCDYIRIFIREDDYSAIAIIRHKRVISGEGEPLTYMVGVEFLDDFYCRYGAGMMR